MIRHWRYGENLNGACYVTLPRKMFPEAAKLHTCSIIMGQQVGHQNFLDQKRVLRISQRRLWINQRAFHGWYVNHFLLIPMIIIMQLSKSCNVYYFQEIHIILLHICWLSIGKKLGNSDIRFVDTLILIGKFQNFNV